MFFAVKQIVEYYYKAQRKPKIEGYLHLRKTIFTAFAIVHEYRETVKEALKGIDNVKEILNMDYCYFVQYDNKGTKLY